jgi:23S rRNA pseudouridine1911/1915/1917 synthase
MFFMTHGKSQLPLATSCSKNHFHFFVNAEQAGCRLDQFLVRLIPDASRSVLSDAVRRGTILVNDGYKKCSYCLKAEESVAGFLPAPPVMTVLPEDIPLNILFEDSHLLVLSKPPGLVVHPGSGNHAGTLVNGLLHYCQSIVNVGDDLLRPGIVHRLDKDTSGLMVVAKEERTHRSLVDAFKNRMVQKNYLALLKGYFERKTGRIVAPIGRHSVHRQKMTIREDGRYAATAWQVLQEFSAGFSLVQLQIETGRTHQIRVHMASLGHPVAGDQLYYIGPQNRIFPRQMLHSSQLGFTHPVTGESLLFSAPLWDDFSSIVDQFSAEVVQCGLGRL